MCDALSLISHYNNNLTKIVFLPISNLLNMFSSNENRIYDKEYCKRDWFISAIAVLFYVKKIYWKTINVSDMCNIFMKKSHLGKKGSMSHSIL